jgi:hypothetical protein
VALSLRHGGPEGGSTRCCFAADESVLTSATGRQQNERELTELNWVTQRNEPKKGSTTMSSVYEKSANIHEMLTHEIYSVSPPLRRPLVRSAYPWISLPHLLGGLVIQECLEGGSMLWRK